MPNTQPPDDNSQRFVHLRVEQDPEESLVFHVESEKYKILDGETWLDHAYRVDLEAIPVQRSDGNTVRNGQCMCGNFDKRRHKDAQNGTESRCKHILAALVFCAENKIVEESNNRKGVTPRRRPSIFSGLT